jgi:hypothetical protein
MVGMTRYSRYGVAALIAVLGSTTVVASAQNAPAPKPPQTAPKPTQPAPKPTQPSGQQPAPKPAPPAPKPGQPTGQQPAPKPAQPGQPTGQRPSQPGQRPPQAGPVVGQRPSQPGGRLPKLDDDHYRAQGWEKLGDKNVGGRNKIDHDKIEVGKKEGRFRQLLIVIEDSDLELVDFKVNFVKGEDWHPSLGNGVFFRENQTKLLDFPGDDRAIKHIKFAYRNLPGGGRASVEVWAR